MPLLNAGHPLWKLAGWLPFVTLLGSVTFLSLTPSPGAAFETFSDKLLHFVGWGGLLCALHFAWRQQQRFIFAALSLWAYSILIEILQPLTGRQFSGADILANGLGVVAALCLTPGLSWLYLSLGLWPKAHPKL